jgi:hypothetical protein
LELTRGAAPLASELSQMVKRALLAFILVAGGLGIGSKAMAWSDCDTGGGYAYPTTYAVGYGGYAPYVGYAPRVAYYPPVPVRSYPVYYGRVSDGHHHHHRDHHNGLTISFGF